jgi:hypothetical protein
MGERRFALCDARMVKSADTADLKSADLNRSWGFKSPSGHHIINDLRSILCIHSMSSFTLVAVLVAVRSSSRSCYALDH